MRSEWKILLTVVAAIVATGLVAGGRLGAQTVEPARYGMISGISGVWRIDGATGEISYCTTSGGSSLTPQMDRPPLCTPWSG